MKNKSIAVFALDVPAKKKSTYPEPFASRMLGREKRALGDFFGLKNFGVNMTRLAPGAQSALLHRHNQQEEFIYIIEGQPTLLTENEETLLSPGMCIGFIPNGDAHHLINRTTEDVLYLEIGDRMPTDEVSYPNDDLMAVFQDNHYIFTHKDGKKY